MLILRKLFFKNQWLSYLNGFMGEMGENVVETILLSLVMILILLAVYILPPLFVSLFIAEFADDFNKRFDWVGIERTFQQVFQILRKRTEDQYLAQKKLFVKSKIGKVIINLISLAILIAIIIFTPVGFRKFSETTGYFQKELKVEDYYEAVDEGDAGEVENDLPVVQTMVITESSANIRSGPGTDYDVVTTASRGDEFIATGNQETASNGRIWYEIYLDEDKTEVGWASQKIIDFK